MHRRANARQRRADVQAQPSQLVPPGTSAVQTIPDFYGFSGHRSTGHLIWLPDAFTVKGATWSYWQASNYPIIYMHGGQGATPTTTATNTLSRWKTAMSDGR